MPGWPCTIHPDYQPSFEGCLVLVAGQGAFKTKGLRQLLPAALRDYFKEGLTLNVSNKDSKVTAVTCWLAELGELEATFKKSDINETKGWLSQQVDRSASRSRKNGRSSRARSAYVGTVNDLWFLADETGNRRFWPLIIDTFKIGWSEAEIEQLWAEAWSLYASGEQWWPTVEEERLLAENAERYRYKSALEENIEDYFQWGQAPDLAQGAVDGQRNLPQGNELRWRAVAPGDENDRHHAGPAVA